MDNNTQAGRERLRAELLKEDNSLILEIPKVELHVHIEGTLTPEMRWKLAMRNGIPIPFGVNQSSPKSLEELSQRYKTIISGPPSDNPPAEHHGVVPTNFFEAYFSGFTVLQKELDFYDLALRYFERASAMNVRYCEIFFDPQGHTRRGVAWSTMMDGFRKAQHTAASELNVQSTWIACFERNLSPESAMEHYEALLKYKDMVSGIGLAAEEDGRPPALFEEVFVRARKDGFKITAHCNVGTRNIHEHIRQVISEVGGSGTDRLDHGLDAADKPHLVDLMLQKDLPMTLIPWAYVPIVGYEGTAKLLRVLSEAGVKISISSDDPPYVNDCWVTHNIMLARRMCEWQDQDVIKMIRQSVGMSWANLKTKQRILDDMDHYLEERRSRKI